MDWSAVPELGDDADSFVDGKILVEMDDSDAPPSASPHRRHRRAEPRATDEDAERHSDHMRAIQGRYLDIDRRLAALSSRQYLSTASW